MVMKFTTWEKPPSRPSKTKGRLSVGVQSEHSIYLGTDISALLKRHLFPAWHNQGEQAFYKNTTSDQLAPGYPVSQRGLEEVTYNRRIVLLNNTLNLKREFVAWSLRLRN
jgi:hypothetical protein